MTQPTPDPAPSSPSSTPDRAPRETRPAGGKVLSNQSPILPLGLLAIGGYLTWFGVHYWRTDVKWPTDPIRALLTGKSIPAAESTSSLAQEESLTALFQTGGQAGNAAPSGSDILGGVAGIASGGNAAIAAAALKYQGAGYQFGGRADTIGNWDCSSFVFYVLAHDMGLPVLGGKWGAAGYPPHVHGPTAVQYKMYGTAVSTPSAGDIVAWNTHVGIAIDANRICSARTPSEGTGISTISGTSHSINETPVFRRASLGK